ncbi:Proteasome regulatory subunit [Entamoeba marina]
MPESTIIILDTSDFMRNGDYTPTRMEAQIEAVQAIASGRLRKNPENHVGFIASGTESKRILVTLTNDFGKILSGLHGIHVGGTADIKQALLVSKLALANRVDKIHTQRIILFVGSPVTTEQEEMNRVINVLKKNNIEVDVISFGEVTENASIVEMVPAAMGEESKLVTVPPGPHVLLDMIAKTEIIMRDGGLNTFDPEFDPEYAAAIQASLQDGPGAAQAYDEEELIRRAIAASLEEYNNPQPPQQTEQKEKPMEELTLDEEMEMAIKMSMEQDVKEGDKKRR